MPRANRPSILPSIALALLAAAGPAAEGGGLVQRYYALGEEAAAAGRPEEAREHFLRVLERDPRHLPSLHRLALLARAAGETDEAIDDAGRFLDTWRHLERPPRELAGARSELAAFVKEADPLRRDLDRLRRSYVGELLKLANQQMDRGAWHSARAMLAEALATDPEHPELAAGLARIRLEGGDELAVEDETGGADPLAGVTSEWVAENDPLHAEWAEAWTLETEHYRVRTNAGYRALMTVANAMEQMQVFYRIFHQYKTDGGAVPVAGVHLFKNRDEYKTLGGSPVDWAAGHWDGSKVVTYDQRGGGEGSLRGTLQVLFHEASHQFTSLAGGSSVPAWLNEGMASFFEGTRLLSNGRVDWNLIAPGRLYPLIDDLDGPSPHDLRRVITGQVDDYRVYYPWGWGICYWLYNAEDELGRLLYRPLMREYFQEYHTSNHLERFEEFFVARARVAGVKSLEEFEQRFVEYVHRLEAEDKGQIDAARSYEERGDLQVALEDWQRAVELYDDSLGRDPDHPEVVWKLAHALEQAGQDDRAAGALRQWLAIALLEDDRSERTLARLPQAEARIRKLDRTARRLETLRRRYHADSVELAGAYRELGFPRTALRVLRGPATALPPSEEARELYFAIQDESGVSLATWRLLFNEQDLQGFYGDGAENFRVVDGTLLARVESDEAGGAAGGGSGTPRTGPVGAGGGDVFAFRRLFIDREPAGDWSLAAEVALGEDCRMAGLCFGKKADGLFHGVVLLPKGFVDLSAFGTDGEPLMRNGVALEKEWQRLQIDVAGTRLVVSVNGALALEYEFASRAELAGDFGLLAGAGHSSYRDIKMLEYDRGLPRRQKIGRRRAAAAIAAGGGFLAPERARPGRTHLRGSAPPALRGLTWHGEPPEEGDLDRLLGWPVVLVFWTTLVEKGGTTKLLDGLGPIEALCDEHAVPLLFVNNEPPEVIEEWLREHPNRHPLGNGYGQEVYEDYAIADPNVQLPRVLLLDLDGTVFWEGNPDYHPDYGTYVEKPLRELIAKGRLPELTAARAALRRATGAFAAGDWAAAAEIWKGVVALGVVHPIVERAREGLAQLELLVEDRLASAELFAQAERRLQAMALLRRAAGDFLGTIGAEKARRRADELGSTKTWRAALKLENRMARAHKHLVKGDLAALRASLEEIQAKEAPGDDPWVGERCRWLLEHLAAAPPRDELIDGYLAAFPELTDPREVESAR